MCYTKIIMLENFSVLWSFPEVHIDSITVNIMQIEIENTRVHFSLDQPGAF
jgi:hypothetical protein